MKKKFIIPVSEPERPYLMGSQCKLCKTTFFPQKHVCPICMKEAMTERALSRRGKIYSYSLVEVAPPGVEAPYVIGLIDLPEGPRILSIIEAKDPSRDAVAVGNEVELIVGKVAEDGQGNDVIGIMFKQVQEDKVDNDI